MDRINFIHCHYRLKSPQNKRHYPFQSRLRYATRNVLRLYTHNAFRHQCATT